MTENELREASRIIADLTKEIPCPTCEGTGKVICDHCRGLELEMLPCYECESEGKIGCPDCEGSGYINKV